MKLIYDVPRCEGVKNAIARAYQQCTFAWQAKRECISNDDGSWGYLVPARSGREHTIPAVYNGIPYSSTRVLDKLVGLDISFSTFLSATENPASIVYTRELSDDTDPAYNPRITNAYFIYGTVCSSLASYAMDLPIHYSTREWEVIPELYEVAKTSIDEIELADTIVTFNKALGHTGGHVAVITSIARDENGLVQRVEITEGWEPTQRYRWDSRAAFTKRMLHSGGNYVVYRRKDISAVRPPLAVKRAPTDLMPDLGAFSAYREGDAVQFNIMKNADALVIESENGEKIRADLSNLAPTEIDGVAYRIYTAKSLPPAFYRAYLLFGEEKSEDVIFSVVRAPKPRVIKADGSAPARITVTPVAVDGTPLTKDSPCLYKAETGALLKTAPFAYSYEGKLYPAYGALRQNGETLTMRPAVPMYDESGAPVSAFEIGKPTALCIDALVEGERVTVDFSGAVACKAYSLCPKEEAAVTFDQRLITDAERTAETLTWQAIPSIYNRFVGLSVVYKNEYGKTTSDPAYFLIL